MRELPKIDNPDALTFLFNEVIEAVNTWMEIHTEGSGSSYFIDNVCVSTSSGLKYDPYPPFKAAGFVFLWAVAHMFDAHEVCDTHNYPLDNEYCPACEEDGLNPCPEQTREVSIGEWIYWAEQHGLEKLSVLDPDEFMYHAMPAFATAGGFHQIMAMAEFAESLLYLDDRYEMFASLVEGLKLAHICGNLLADYPETGSTDYGLGQELRWAALDAGWSEEECEEAITEMADRCYFTYDLQDSGLNSLFTDEAIERFIEEDGIQRFLDWDMSHVLDKHALNCAEMMSDAEYAYEVYRQLKGEM